MSPNCRQRTYLLLHSLLVFCCLLSGTLSAAEQDAIAPSGQPRPNVLLILADDLGWSDLGSYGGEIDTPNLDRLANRGVRFTQFYNSARCSPTRASILTGLHPHQAGFPNLSGILPKSSVTIPEVLRRAGYRSTMVGKWHLNTKNPPTERGFEEFYGMLGGFNSCWQEDPFFTRWPQDRVKRTYTADEFYSTDAFADYSIDFIGDGKSSQPWFQYLAFNAPHFPLHAPASVIAKYESMYFEKGWDKIRDERLARQKSIGLIEDRVTLPPLGIVPANRFNEQTGWNDKEIPAWDSLPEDRRRDLARRMAVYAAMVDKMDSAIGRILKHLEQTGQFDNTLILFLSDNGACAEWDPWGFDKSSGPQNILHTGDSLARVGSPGDYTSYGSGWALTCNTPLRFFKHYNHEGGIRTPLIAHWPSGLLQSAGKVGGGIWVREPGYITDFMPTLVEVAKVTYPLTFNDSPIMPMEGISFLPLLTNSTEKRNTDQANSNSPWMSRAIFIEHEGNRSVRQGEWKLVSRHSQPWELYRIETDPTEMYDLAGSEPGKMQVLAEAWEAWAKRCNVNQPSITSSSKLEKEWSELKVANRTVSIRCRVDAKSERGVIMAHGGVENGYSLHLAGDSLFFTVRIDRAQTAIRCPRPMEPKFAIRADLSESGAMQLFVDNQVVATGNAGGLIQREPKDALSVGRDERTNVGDYEAPFPFKGEVLELKIETAQSTKPMQE